MRETFCVVPHFYRSMCFVSEGSFMNLASGVHGWPFEFCGPWNVSFIFYYCLRVFVEPVIASGGLLGLPP